MRLSLVSWVLVLAGGGCLTGCGDGSDGVAAEPSVAPSPAVSSTPTSPATEPTPARSDTEQTCVDLYYPPGHLMPRAIEFVHGSPAGDPVTEAKVITSGLTAVAGPADPMLAADIAIVRIAVDTQRALVQSDSDVKQDLRSFDEAADRLDAACATYGE